MDYPFFIYKRKNSDFYYVAFKNSLTNKYDVRKSTGQTDEKQAIKTAWNLYAQGIPTKQKDNSHNANKVTKQESDIIGLLKTGGVSETAVNGIINALKESGYIKSVVIKDSKQDIKLIDYLLNFWDWEKSPYIKERKRKGQQIHKNHASQNCKKIIKYWLPYFKDKLLGDVTRQDLKDFLESLSVFNIANTTKNQLFSMGATALRYAFNNEIIENNIASEKSFILYSQDYKKREILTKELMQAVLSVEWKHYTSKLAFFVSVFSGMRAGEIQALRLQDLGSDCIYVNHSFNYVDGLKEPKNGERRVAHFPFIDVLERLKKLGYENIHNESFIFWGLKKGVPMDSKIWLDDFRLALKSTGLLNDEEVKKYCFHGQRHFFTTYMKDLKTENRVLQLQTGHKTLAMLEHYANHETEKATKEIIDNQSIMYKELVGDNKELSPVTTYRKIKKINLEQLCALLPKPNNTDAIKALQEVDLISGDTYATDKGFSICVYYLLKYGYTVKTKDFKHIKSIDGKLYTVDTLGAIIRNIKKSYFCGANTVNQ